jgi:predicted kinase
VSTIVLPCPAPPSWRVDWQALQEYPWVRALAGCPQDPQHHAEGDVWIHLRMVCEALAALPAWRALPAEERQVVYAAALLHDVAKPACTRTDADGRLSARGHSRKGAIMARQILWRLGVPLREREQVAALVLYHQVPFHLLERADCQRRAITVSQTARCDHLALLAEADARGRHCADPARLLDNIALFCDYCREQDCFTAPRPFASDHARFRYFRDERRHPDAAAHDDLRGEVVLMSGLPGAGKDHWVRTNLAGWPVVSLDALREELDVSPAGKQGEVLTQARTLAREHLRAGRAFVWNATNLSRQVRGECVRLFAAYKARIRIVYIDVMEETLLRQNRQRSAPVPEEVIERLLSRWEVPDRTEAHRVDWVAPGE